MADLEFSPSLNGFVLFGMVATATETIEPSVLDALFVRASGTCILPDGIRAASLTIGGGEPGATPLVQLAPGSVFAPNVLVTTGGALRLGPDPALADPSSLAVLTGAISIAPGAVGVTATACLFAGSVSVAGPLIVQGYATFVAPLEFAGTPDIISFPGSRIVYSADLASPVLQAILAAPDFAGTFTFGSPDGIGGTLDNAGTTLDLASVSALSFANATIAGGGLIANPSAVVSGTTLDNVVLSGTLVTPADAANVATGTLTGGSLVVEGSFGFADIAVIDQTDIALGAGAKLYGANAFDVTFTANTAIHISDAATISFAAAGSHLQLDGTLDLSASVSPYRVDILSSGGAVQFGASAEISIGANATLRINSALFNSGTIPIIGGTLELAQAGGSLGTLRFAGSDAALRLDAIGQSATLLDFQDGDHLIFPAASTSNAHVVLNGSTVEVFSGNNKLAGRFVLNRSDGGSYALQDFTFGTSGGALAVATSGIAITACYAAGTRIETEAGERPIEALQPGELVRTLDGALAPICWLGHRTLDLRRHPRPHDVQPIRITAHAFGPGLPRRDLVLSPDHAVFAEGALVPVRYLLNGATIIQEHRDRVTYHHLELARHDVVLAEGLAAETYLDTGNRAAFANGGGALHLHPDFAVRLWQAHGFAPLLTKGDTLALIRHTLLAQAATLGHRRTCAPDYRLTTGVEGFHLASRISVPAHVDPASDDHRPLGLAVTAIIADGEPLRLDDPRLTMGWHAPEPGLRWTDGAACIALPPTTHLIIEHLPLPPVYWLPLENSGAAVQRAG